VGSEFLAEAARAFVRVNSPRRPCVAEYGEEFPAFVATRPNADTLPYLRDFVELDRLFGQAAAAVDEPPIAVDDRTALDDDVVTRSALVLQPGVRYHEASWPVDQLLGLYLTDDGPDRFAMAPCHVYLEFRGARGEVAPRPEN
jgi:hypothetical protein